MFLFLMQSCIQNTKSKVENRAREFMSAYKDQDIERMREVYPGIDNIEVFFASDTSFVNQVTATNSTGQYRVDIVSLYMNEQNDVEVQNVILFLNPDGKHSSGYYIVDSKGIASWKSYPHSEFALKTGCVQSDSDMTDQQAMERLRVAKDLLFYFSKLMYQDLEESVMLSNTHILKQGKQNASGTAYVENKSDYTLPDLKYIIVYYDDGDKKIGEEGGWVTQSPLSSGESVEFEFTTSFDKDAVSADFKLDFDLELIMQFVLEDDIYTGKEYEAFVTKQLINI